MDDEKAIVILALHKSQKKIDLELPLYITVNDLIFGLNQAYSLGFDTTNLGWCCLKTENPIALLKGDRTLKEYGIHNGTVINIT